MTKKMILGDRKLDNSEVKEMTGFREIDSSEIEEIKAINTKYKYDFFTQGEYDALKNAGFTVAALLVQPYIHVFYEYDDGWCIRLFRNSTGYFIELGNNLYNTLFDGGEIRNVHPFDSFKDLLDYLKG